MRPKTISLTRTISILHRVDLHGGGDDDYVTFERHLDEPDEAQRLVHLHAADWVDLGVPDTITVTIEAGDLLN